VADLDICQRCATLPDQHFTAGGLSFSALAWRVLSTPEGDGAAPEPQPNRGATNAKEAAAAVATEGAAAAAAAPLPGAGLGSAADLPRIARETQVTRGTIEAAPQAQQQFARARDSIYTRFGFPNPCVLTHACM